MSEATHLISAVYFPGTGEVELSWEDVLTNKTAYLTASVTPQEGEAIAQCVPPCVYHGAVVKEPNQQEQTHKP